MFDYFSLKMPKEKLGGVSTLGLAHVGDGVFELMVRSWLCLNGKATAKGLHKATVRYVSAPAQAAMIKKVMDELTAEEADVYRRGRNSSPHSIPQNASREEYAAATALEALFGWLWLKGDKARLNELFAKMMGEVE